VPYPADKIAELIQKQMPYGQEPNTTFVFPPSLDEPASFATAADYSVPNNATQAALDQKRDDIADMRKNKVRVSGWLSQNTAANPYLGELTLDFLPPDQRDGRLVWSFDGEEHEIAKAICVPYTFRRTGGHRDGTGRQGFLLIGFVGSGHE
jgi:hypothetical protein